MAPLANNKKYATVPYYARSIVSIMPGLTWRDTGHKALMPGVKMRGSGRSAAGATSKAVGKGDTLSYFRRTCCNDAQKLQYRI